MLHGIGIPIKIQLLQLWSKVWLTSEGALRLRIQGKDYVLLIFVPPESLEEYQAHSKNSVNVCSRTQREYKAGKGTKTFKETGIPVFEHFLFVFFLEATNKFRIGLPLFSRRFGRNEQLCFTEFICLFPNENYSPWSVASQLVAVGMITDQKQKDYIPFSRANE